MTLNIKVPMGGTNSSVHLFLLGKNPYSANSAVIKAAQ